MYAIILILLVVILKELFFASEDDKITENAETEIQNAEVQKTVNQFYQTWNISSLKSLIYQKIEIYPYYEKSLSKAYDEQLKLLQGIEKRCKVSIAKVKIILLDNLNKCNNLQSITYLKKQFEWVLEMVPELNEQFEGHRIKFNKSYTKKNTNLLFHACQSPEEAKKRFRRLAFLNHPDRGGSAAAMKEIIRQYEEFLKS